MNMTVEQTRLYVVILSMEMAKLDPSGVGYEMFRKVFAKFAPTDIFMPTELRQFLADEAMRDRPFHPDKGMRLSDKTMTRAMTVGSEIQAQKRENPARSVYGNIIPALAKAWERSESTISKDYEQRYVPVFDEGNRRTCRIMNRYYPGQFVLAA